MKELWTDNQTLLDVRHQRLQTANSAAAVSDMKRSDGAKITCDHLRCIVFESVERRLRFASASRICHLNSAVQL